MTLESTADSHRASWPQSESTEAGSPGDEELPHVWVVCACLGRASEAWLWRQVTGFRRTSVKVICRGNENPVDYPTPHGMIAPVLFHDRPITGSRRWLHRAINARRVNFHAATRSEVAHLLSLAATHRPKAIIAHFGQMALRVLPVAERLGIPLVAHFHGMDVSSLLKDPWYRWSLLHALPKFASVVVVGERQKRWMLEHGVDAARLQLIPCGVPTELFSPAAQSSVTFKFICVSRLVEQKGVALSIKAFAKVQAVISETRLCVIGDGPEAERLKDLAASLGVADRVDFMGALPANDVRRALRTSDVFLQHSLTWRDGAIEGFGLSIAEASACGLPVVATRSGGIMDQIIDGENGCLVEERDIDGMARAILNLANDSELRSRMGRAGRARVVALYDSHSQIRKLEDTVLSLVNGNRT